MPIEPRKTTARVRHWLRLRLAQGGSAFSGWIDRLLGAQPLHQQAIGFLADADELEQRPVGRAINATLYLLVALLLIFILWATFSEVDQIVTARGKLVTPLPNIVVQPLETAVIQSIDVRLGQVVKKGERLATLDATFVGADLRGLSDRVQSLSAQASRLDSEVRGDDKPGASDKSKHDRIQANILSEKTAGYRANLAKFSENIARLEASQQTNRNDQQVLEARRNSLQEIEAMQEKLMEKQFGSRLKMLESREKRLEVERDLTMAKNREAELRKELAAAVAERQGFSREWRQKSYEEQVNVRRERDAAGEQLNKAELRNALVVMRSPTDAVVLEIAHRSVGSVAKEAEPLFTLVPLDAPLEAEVQVDSSDVCEIWNGEVVRVKIDSYPFQKHGVLAAEVRIISEDTFSRDPAAMRQAQQSDSYYLSRVSLKEMV
ncbi:MAG: HlyD family type I secretion periplasmic adaptor subunit, partial [Sideroxyarcus sp.]|nr:HlyD family type I secretion periplasmic adaptor subunit [Sideroxyarcus sp.]